MNQGSSDDPINDGFAIELRRELDKWADTGRTATMWWRDDDTSTAGLGLRRLLKFSERHQAPLGLAVIPANMSESLAPALAGSETVTVIQHGYAHISHAPKGQKLGLWELGRHRPDDIVFDEMTHGKEILEAAFGERFLPVMAPPWNRIDWDLFPGLADLGYCGVTVSGIRPTARPIPELIMANIHSDVTRWETPAGSFRGEREICRAIAVHLRDRRVGKIDANEPTGLTTHQLVLCEESWRFLDKFLELVTTHPGARWLSAADIFAPAPNR